VLAAPLQFAIQFRRVRLALPESHLPSHFVSPLSKGVRAVSLFGDRHYQYRDTYFVLFNQQNRPSEAKLKAMLHDLGSKFETSEIRHNEGQVESLTLIDPQDYSAMDIAYVEGEDVVTQIGEIREEFRAITVRGEDVEKLKRLKDFDARFDIFHFEQVVDDNGEEDEYVDPGGLLLLMEHLVKLCHGVGYDPQSQSLI
jgi:hypothetical protein